MSEYAVEVHNLSKMFKLYPSQGKRLLDYVSFGKKKLFQEFWALRDISFNVPKGTTFGILGQNGSGKSTLLSILAGVVDPSGGFFSLQGKISAILELGAGFHPEFTGRANVYMYGSIMGLSKEEIDKRMPEIIYFSELGDFIDQPLRTYSSGMYARLAFSVAVNVNAEILIVDEALAVGDALFQHRCFRKIHEMKESGKTILYVGHDTEAVRSLCDHAMILDGGRMLEIGDSATISNKYLALIAEREQKYYEANLQEYGEKPDENWETTYNFIDHLPDAEKKIQTPESVREVRIDIKNAPRRTIFAHPPSELFYQVFVSPGSVLSFGIGIYPSAYDFIEHGVQFSVYINEEEIFSQTLEPKKNKSDQGWHNQMINLSAYEGREVSVRFITEGSGQDISYCWGGWGWVNILAKKQENIEDISAITPESNFRIGNRKAEVVNIEVLDENFEKRLVFHSGEKVRFRTHINVNEDLDDKLGVGWVIRNRLMDVAGTNTYEEKVTVGPRKSGESFIAEYCVSLNLNHGIYYLQTGCFLLFDSSYNQVEVLDRHYDKVMFEVLLKEKRQSGVANLNGSVSIIESY
jgi:ABC-type polysaccharide/polyol phosphate transport system ATPase subunit